MRLRDAWFVIVLLATSQLADAGTWKIGNAAGNPGSQVNIQIVFQGDGVTKGAQIELGFDETRLSLPVLSGAIPGANQAGQCERSAQGKLSTFYFPGGGVLPGTDTVVCTIPFTISTGSRSGRMKLFSISPLCAPDQGVSCAVVDGWVDVLGQYGSRSFAPGIEDTPALSLLLRSTAMSNVDELIAHSYTERPESSLVAAFRKVPPLSVTRVNSIPVSGDALERITKSPELPEAIFERYVTATFRSIDERNEALKLLQADSTVENVAPVYHYFSDEESSVKTQPRQLAKSSTPITQLHLALVNAPNAWSITGGWGLVGVMDNGIDPTHPAFNPLNANGVFSTASNYLPYLSRNLGEKGQTKTELNEIQPSYADDSEELQACGPSFTYPKAGHGTHVAGLIAANPESGVKGVCRGCGLAVFKRSFTECNTPGGALTQSSSALFDAAAITHAAKMGVQVLNISSSHSSLTCSHPQAEEYCTALELAKSLDVLMVGASGNDRTSIIYFPARDPRVVAVGGLGPSPTLLWNEMVDGTGCPTASPFTECGSNYGPGTSGSVRQELVAPAKSVYSSVYRSLDWSDLAQCGDSKGSPPTLDGTGPCTGTSMSAPIVSGVFGILRSINPLMTAGDPFNIVTSVDGVRDVVTTTGSKNGTEDSQFGFGYPNAYAAAKKMLGTVRFQAMQNRGTPLFGLVSPGGDYAAVATPQLAMSLSLHSVSNYTSTGDLIAGYGSFPNPAAPIPRAMAIVMTTPVRPYGGTPELIPLYLMEKKPLPCNGEPFCRGDHILVSSDSQVATALGLGYKYMGRQGYIYQACAVTACPPLGAEALHLKCNASGTDCAVFLEKDVSAFAGYSNTFAGASSSVLGYAYRATNSDGDALPDGVEFVIGTSPWVPDSDGDSVMDSNEYSMTGTPTSDPCAGSIGLPFQCSRVISQILYDGFE